MPKLKLVTVGPRNPEFIVDHASILIQPQDIDIEPGDVSLGQTSPSRLVVPLLGNCIDTIRQIPHKL
jgi:hypothetical protein